MLLYFFMNLLKEYERLFFERLLALLPYLDQDFFGADLDFLDLDFLDTDFLDLDFFDLDFFDLDFFERLFLPQFLPHLPTDRGPPWK